MVGKVCMDGIGTEGTGLGHMGLNWDLKVGIGKGGNELKYEVRNGVGGKEVVKHDFMFLFIVSY